MRRIAVVGSGVAGLTAAYVLQKSYDVTLFEADDRLGGHAHTHDVGGLAVDTGFIVHNDRTYPLLTRLFREVGVTTQDSDMSMSVRCDGCGLEYAGGCGIGGLFAQSRALLRPRYLRMLAEVPRFHRAARRLLATDTADTTLGAFLTAGGYSPYFVSHFVRPLVAAVWSCPPATALRYPARYLFAFLANHGMLSVSGTPQWKTVVGGSRSYVERVAKELTAVHTNTPVRALARTAGGIEIHDDADTVATFDAAVVATHPDQALRLLAAPTPAETTALRAFEYSPNEALLHTDDAVLPVAAGARASWNYRLASCADPADSVHVSYDMNRLQRLRSAQRHIVTLNGTGAVREDLVLRRMMYEHPVFTPESVAAQALLPGLNDGRIAFAGAYHGWGFHEDGCRSGVEAAKSLGGAW